MSKRPLLIAFQVTACLLVTLLIFSMQSMVLVQGYFMLRTTNNVERLMITFSDLFIKETNLHSSADPENCTQLPLAAASGAQVAAQPDPLAASLLGPILLVNSSGTDTEDTTEPVPESASEADPIPETEPAPKTESEPTPAPELEPTPAPTPTPAPELEPTPAPTPTPETETEPTPAPALTANLVSATTEIPVKVALPQPVAAPAPAAQVTADKLANLKIPVLVYHHIREQAGWPKTTWSWKMTVSPAVFDEQMAWLQDRGYTTINLDTMVNILGGKVAAPAKPVVITFDDNQLNSYHNGLPILEKYGHTATFFLVSNRLNDPDSIGLKQIPNLIDKGMDIQSHTVSHANLTKLSASDIYRQLVDSRKVLEAATGRPVNHVAYPLTAHNATVRDQVHQAGYKTGLIMDPRPVTTKDNPYKVPRIMMTDDTDLARILP